MLRPGDRAALPAPLPWTYTGDIDADLSYPGVAFPVRNGVQIGLIDDLLSILGRHPAVLLVIVTWMPRAGHRFPWWRSQL